MASRAPLSDLYHQMVKMRRFEEALGNLWLAGLISGEMHLGIGEEGIAAGVLAHLESDDGLALDHRPTPALVGSGVDIETMTLEMLGSEDGLCRGRGGHMHLFDPGHMAASSGIVGASAPLACGFALANLRLRPGRIAVAFFGESALNQGMTMEAMNLAAVWKLPVLFVVKDNGWAITTSSRKMTGGSIHKRAAGLGVPSSKVAGDDVAAVWKVAGKAVGRLRRGAGPQLIHATCKRPRGHFENDPLIEMVNDPIGSTSEITGIVRGLADSGGSGPGARLAGAGAVTKTALRMAWHLRGPARDPLERAAGRLDPQQREGLLEDAAGEVDQAVASALKRAGMSWPS
ncbi:MAG: thiamine pyrophosphate-dependent dehydrogenase E1 component subunit alpha [Acidimicrobiia bacterium]|nr:thiamine pyrophosphate-dependent dehydrogenase E1 component subunit alpha [Acidimicrobiia bacterium]